MTTAVQYWRVGSRTEERLDLTIADVAGHLIADWIPSLPSVSAVDLMGWPYYLLQNSGSAFGPYLAIDKQVGTCERQWKGVVSWMLGVACARKVLSEEGYQWVAPVSAFYPDRRTLVDTWAWHADYPSSLLEIDGDPTSATNLRPDYVVLRSVGGTLEWALAESKGTSASLANMACPQTWREQVRNALVHMRLPDGTKTEIPITRHIVVATRVNPNAVRETTRRLQVRAWNSAVRRDSTDARAAEIEVMAAHLYGVCRNLSLFQNASAIATAARLRRRARLRNHDREVLAGENAAADEELRAHDVNLQGYPARFSFPGRQEGRGRLSLEVTLESSTVQILRSIRELAARDDDVGYRLVKSASELEAWYGERRTTRSERMSIQREGIVVELT